MRSTYTKILIIWLYTSNQIQSCHIRMGLWWGELSEIFVKNSNQSNDFINYTEKEYYYWTVYARVVQG